MQASPRYTHAVHDLRLGGNRLGPCALRTLVPALNSTIERIGEALNAYS